MEHTRTLSREFTTGEKAVLHIEARSGSVIVEGRTSDRVTIDAVLRIHVDNAAEAEEAVENLDAAMEQDAHRVIIRTPQLQRRREGWQSLIGLGGTRIDYHVRVPLQTAVRVLSRSGSVQITHIQAVVHTEVLSGKLDVTDIEGNVSASSRSGAVTVDRIKGNLTVDARSGKVRVRAVSGSVEIECRSGTVEIEDAGDVRLSSSSGSASVSQVRGTLHARTRAGSFRYRGRVCGDMDIEARVGSILMAVDPAYPFYLDAESHAGSVSSELKPRRGGAPPAAGGPQVKLRSRAGSIRLVEV